MLSRRAWFAAAGMTTAAIAAGCGLPKKAAAPAEVTHPVIRGADQALAELLDGNRRFVTAKRTYPDQSIQVRRELSTAQKPFAVVLTCSDSRVPPEVVFDQGLGDLFVVRLAGNIVDQAVRGSIEYAVEEFGTPLIMVLGHQSCGAVAATLKALQPPFAKPAGEVGTLVAAIAPAVEAAKGRPGDLLDNAVRANAIQSADQIRTTSELTTSLDSGAVKLVVGYYSLQDGTVSII
jgi:carbonic anhydrase